jgi:hypothetical protein
MRAASQTDEFKRCEEFIVWLQTEIESRQSQEDHSPDDDLDLVPAIA